MTFALAPGCDVRALPLTPTEGFVLSRIDGNNGATELSLATGLPESTVREALARLAELGAVRRSDAPPQGSSDAPRSPSGAPISQAVAAGVAVAQPPAFRPPAVSYDEALLEEEVDIGSDQKREILDLYFSLETLTLYELLGVAADAPKKSIKQAYFEKVVTLHPDRFFGKQVGQFKSKIERVFSALTKAHDTLTKNQTRAEYDAYLSSRSATVALRSSRAPTPASRPHQASAESIPPAAPIPNLGGFAPGEPSTRVGSEEAAEEARRHMARKLRTSLPPVAPAHSDAPPALNAREALDAQLRARYEARLKDPGAVERHLSQAAQAEAAQKWPTAVSALKSALELRPGDPKIQSEIERVETLADRAYAPRFIEQARYEERDGQFERASRSYERAARGKSSPDLYVQASLCQLRATGGRRAVELARKAVALAPTALLPRLTLAKAYFAEGMTASALAEAARALEIDPKNEEAKRLQNDFKKSTAG